MPEDSGYNLEAIQVLHIHHPLQNDPADASAAVVLGFEWAEMPPDQGFFICQCTKDCVAPEVCGKRFYSEAHAEIDVAGRMVPLKMPWTDGAGEQVVFELWACPVCMPIATGAVFDTWVGRFFDIPARLLQYEHEARARTYDGVRRSLGKRYPDAFTEASYVTVILYRRTL